MSGYSIINYKGKEISYLDYRGLNEKQMIQTLNEAAERALQENKQRLLLVNIKGIYVWPDFLTLAKAIGKRSKHLILKSAIIGAEGAKKALLNFYNLSVGSE